MHSTVEVKIGENGTLHISAFIGKLFKMVNEISTNNLIFWSELGNSFIIRNQARFARDVLPLYFKHNNMASFLRQLNMYGFNKVVSVDQGGLHIDKDEMKFAHPLFIKGQESSLELIKRKPQAIKTEDSTNSAVSTNKMMMDFRQAKCRIETLDNKVNILKRENEALWTEIANLRQTLAKHEHNFNKIIPFFLNLVSPQKYIYGNKRRMPLMINEVEDIKVEKRSRHNSEKDPIAEEPSPECLDSDQREAMFMFGISSDSLANKNNLVYKHAFKEDGEIVNHEGKPGVLLDLSSPQQKLIFHDGTKVNGEFPGIEQNNEGQITSYVVLPMEIFNRENFEAHLDESQQKLRELLKKDSSLKNKMELLGIEPDSIHSDHKKLELVSKGSSEVLNTYNPSLFDLTVEDADFFQLPTPIESSSISVNAT